ncbi:MAG: sensor histidine kinase [Eubacterium sp.]
MDLDTNVKKFKYSTFNKILCVIICLATFAGSARLISGMFFSVMYQEEPIVEAEKIEHPWTATVDFRNLLNNDLSKIYENTIRDAERVRYKKLIAEKKDEAVQKALEYRDKQIERRIENDEYYGEYGDDVYLGDYQCDIDSLCLYLPVYSDDNEASLSQTYDKEAEERLYEMFEWVVYSSRQSISADLNYIAYLNGKVTCSSLTSSKQAEFNKNDVKNNNDYYIAIENSKLTDCKGIEKEIAQAVCEQTVYNTSYKDVDIYLYFDEDDLSSGVLSYISFDESKVYAYSQLKDFDSFAHTYESSKVIVIPIAIALLIISFICGFYYFKISGKKDKDDFARLRFTDYLPFELQLGAGFGIGFGMIMLYVMIYERFTFNAFSLLIVWAMTIVAVVIQIALFCICSANARFANSDKKFYKHCILFWLFFGLWKAIVFIFRLDKKIFRKLKASTKRTFKAFTYKPGNFRKNVIALTIIYAVANLIVFAGIVLLFIIFIDTGGLEIIPIIFAIGDLAGNILILRKVLEYVKNLDMIITASSLHQDIAAQLDTLPESLRVLAESMKYTNAELQQAINKAVKDERLRTELITNVSHDLKTPLTSIITYVDLLSKCDINDEKAKEYIAVLDEKGAKLKRLIDDLIEASKVTSGNITVNASPMNLSELCLQATVDAQPDFEKAGLDLIVKQGETPSTIFADGAKTFRIIENLLSNAKKYSAKGSRVYVSVYDEGDKGIFEIKNISAQPLDISADELTERFVRGDKSRNQDGNGLGLSIAKELCRVQNGNLEITIDGDLFKVKVKLPKNS